MGDEDKKRRRGEPEPTLLDRAKGEGSKNKSMYYCNYCNKDLSNVVRIKCAQCDDFDLCLECFSVGAEVQPHRRDHPYKVMEKLDFPLITEDWTAAEETLLLEGIEMFGLGNWADVAMHVMSKPKGKCESHYFACYVDTGADCMPDLSHAIGKGQFLSRAADIMHQQAQPYMGSADALPYQTAAGSVGKKADGKASNVRTANNFYASCPAGSDVVGFMPARGDFDIEWDNDAELVLCDLTFKPEDTPQETELKTKVLEIYNWKLEERARRKKFILERGLLDLKKQQALDRRRTKDEREMYQQMRVFARFQTPEEHEEFIRGIIMERKIRKRIEQLQLYRQLDIHTLAEGETYEAEKRRKETEKGAKDKYNFGPERKGRRGKEDGAWDSSSTDVLGGKRPRLAATQGPESIHNHLSQRERDLCSHIRITPLQYMAGKDCIIREFVRMGRVNKGTARRLVKVVDVTKTDAIFDFVVSSGWLQADRDPRAVFAGQNGAPTPMA